MRRPRTLLATIGVVGIVAFGAGCGNSTSASTHKPSTPATAAAAAPAAAAASAVQGTLDEWSAGAPESRARAGKVTLARISKSGGMHTDFTVS